MATITTRRDKTPVRSVENATRLEVVSDGRVIRVPQRAWTLEGFRKWALSSSFPKQGRISFIEGELIIDMSPEEFNNHNQIKSETVYVGVGLTKKLDLGKFISDRMLLTHAGVGLSTEPDAALVTWESLKAGRLRLIPRADAQGEFMELEGTPDWILEIVSKFSQRKDLVLLWKKYYEAGVAEYWLINARGRKIDFQILLRGERDFEPAPRRGGWQKSRVFGREFKLERKKDRVGLWEYTLHVR